LIRPLTYENLLEYPLNKMTMFKNLGGYSWGVKNRLYHALIGYPVSD
jgi:hypothetical protein